MARRSYVWDNQKRNWVDAKRYYAKKARAVTHYVIRDLPDYRSVATGEWISGRVKHRDHLKANGLSEVGNERKFASDRPKLERPGYELKRVLEQHGY